MTTKHAICAHRSLRSVGAKWIKARGTTIARGPSTKSSRAAAKAICALYPMKEFA